MNAASAIRNAAMTAIGFFGRFGDQGKPEKELQQIIGGAHKFEPGAKASTRHKNKYKHLHGSAKPAKKAALPNEAQISAELAYGRAVYASRRAKWYPANTDSQIPGSRRGGRGIVAA